jgi:HEAT repeat protein
MKSLMKIVAEIPEVMPQVADLVWGNHAERLRAVDALAATGDRRVLHVLCERIGDPSTDVVALILARIDLVDPITGAQVAREMMIDGRLDHLRVALAYFHCHAPWELPEGAPSPRQTVASLGETLDGARLRRALIARHPGIRRAAAERLAAVADPIAILDLDVHLQGTPRVPLDGILALFLKLHPTFVVACAEAARSTRSVASAALLVALAQVGGRGTSILLSLLDHEENEAVLEVLLRYRPREVLQRCRKWLRDGDSDRSVEAVWILHDFVVEPPGSRPSLRRTALAALVAALDRPQPEVVTHVLRVLSRASDAAAIPCDAGPLLEQGDAEVRCAALELLAAQGRVDRLDAIEQLLGDADGDVRAQALSTLAKLDPARQIERVHVALRDEDPAVRMAALESLDGWAVPSSLCDEGCHMLRQSPGDEWRTLLQWLLKTFPQQSTTILLCALRSKAQVVQDHAAGVLFGCGPEGP